MQITKLLKTWDSLLDMMLKALSTKKNKLDFIQIHISPVQETV